jgi:RNA polymerase sigma-70 factor (ECF subfamily)
MDDIDFAGLIARVKEGDEVAIARLIERYGPEVRMMVRRRLPARLRSQFDTVDFTQVVWNSVIVGCRERPEPFEGPKHLLGFLAGVVHLKIAAEYRRRTRTRKYDIGREEPLYVRRGGREIPREVAAGDPTPSEEVQADDRLEQLVAGRSPLEAEIVGLRSQGLTIDEVAARLGLHEKAVRRVLDALRSRMEARQWR